MCFSFEVSLATWVVALLVSIVLIKRNNKYDRWNAAFILTFTSIQLLEAGLWLTSEGSKSNDYLTRCILVVLMLQPLVQSAGAYVYTKENIALLLTFVYILILLYTIYRVFTESFSTTKNLGGRLSWRSTSPSFTGPIIGVLYLVGLFVPLLFMGKAGIPLIITGILTAIFSMYLTDWEGFGSMWCLISVVYIIVAILV